MRKFIILLCFMTVIGSAFALPLTLSSNGSSNSQNVSEASNKAIYNGQVEHVFTHCLLAYPALALSYENAMQQDYNTDCITPSEFSKILQQLYDNDYALIDINSTFENIDGQIVKKQITMPEGKKPIIFSFDDVNYDHKKLKTGMIDKIIVDSDGNLCAQTETTWTNAPEIQITYDNEFVPILENFVKTHPDFSVNGAKGTICLTGYDGILGYRTGEKNTENRQQEINSAKNVVEKLLNNGWNFACHSFGHYHMTQLSNEQFAEELRQWQEQVEPLIGKTKVYVYPYGEWELYQNGQPTAKHQMLLDAGFELFCGVGINQFFNHLPLKSNSETTKTLFMDRTVIDGNSLRTKRAQLSRLFDANAIYDYKYRP